MVTRRTEDEDPDRMNTKQAMIDLRKLKFGMCYCDLCHQQIGWEMHEWVTRKMTQNNHDLRVASFQEEICSILCPVCHNIAETFVNAKKLIMFNIGLYGFITVRNGLMAIPEIYWPRALIKAWKEVNAEIKA